MVYYLIICRSLTYAQRTAAALERAGIGADILVVKNLTARMWRIPPQPWRRPSGIAS